MQLRTVTRTQGNNEALKDGSVRPRGHEFAFTEVPVLVQAFRRMVRDLEFDVCEMAITTYLCAKAHGKPFTALPVFLVRGFHHSAMVRGADSDVTPHRLEGRRVGVNRGYTVTTGVWARGILQDEYGVDLDRVTWLPTGDEHVAEYRPPANVAPLDAGLDTALADGRVAAAVGIEATHAGLEPLIPDPAEAGFAALRDRGLYPINHLVVVKDELLRTDPGLAVAVFDAFATAKQRYVDRLTADAIAAPTATDRMYRRVMQITGADPLPYGIAPNRAMLEQLIGHAVRQRIVGAAPAVEALFHPATHDLLG
ncbi:ABC transporter substrate-binding protein [Dactylosporangium sp. AC04546]|uniref:ABC transporter substrate-binding protein n=1 Tax=Dactylosporangium sp. AC04546 TaxID=2862460 RepID=UPI001EDDF665|nr:ABC transporter substrate-binding protein [Dactylosporangium sp. AC04546]WVK78864.1 ABC transporter substrate-binding protein [Dactylosporangium sp. AC04546]